MSEPAFTRRLAGAGGASRVKNLRERRDNSQIAHSMVGCTNQATSFVSHLPLEKSGRVITSPVAAWFATPTGWLGTKITAAKTLASNTAASSTPAMALGKFEPVLFSGYWRRAVRLAGNGQPLKPAVITVLWPAIRKLSAH
ncbi:MAG TPA: hypothetical protein VEW71_04530 [Allosphingosinicella sp.]|nr:hypothetical protein [Allosphingosinicella sp.]